MRNILIFGGSGFVGQNLALHYTEKGDRVWLADIVYPTVDRLTSHFIGCDIRQARHVVSCLVQVKPDLIINCAAQTSHPLSMKYPDSDAEVNVIGTLVLMECIRKTFDHVPIIHLSSSTVVGPTHGLDFGEARDCSPIDIYSANKLAAEHYIWIYRHVYGLKIAVLRLPNLYGPYGKDDPAYGVLNFFIQQAARGNDLTVYGDGYQARNVLYIKDAIRAINVEFDTMPDVPVYVPGPKSYFIREIAERIAEIWQVDVVQVPWPEGRGKIEIGDVYISSTFFAEYTGWQAEYDLARGLVDTKMRMERHDRH